MLQTADDPKKVLTMKLEAQEGEISSLTQSRHPVSRPKQDAYEAEHMQSFPGCELQTPVTVAILATTIICVQQGPATIVSGALL